MAERPYKESSHKLTVEKKHYMQWRYYNTPQNLGKEVLKAIHDDVQCGIKVTQRRLKL